MKGMVVKFPLPFPDRVDGLLERLEQANLGLDRVLALLLKTDGNGELNDYSRLVAENAFNDLFMRQLGLSTSEVRERLTIIASSGCEGLIRPHGYALLRTEGSPAGETGTPGGRGLTVAIARTRALKPAEIGSPVQVRLVAEATKEALRDAGVEPGEKEVLVFVKAPVCRQYVGPGTGSGTGRGSMPGKPGAVTGTGGADPRASLGATRAASALGVAVALGEVEESAISPEAIGTRWDLYTEHGLTFSGNELADCRVIALANSSGGDPLTRLEVRAVKGLSDLPPILGLLEAAGMARPGTPPVRLVALFAKIGIQPTGTAMPYSDLSPIRQVRSAAGGLLVPLAGDAEVFVSSGAEHQGPSGGGLIAALISQEGGEGR